MLTFFYGAAIQGGEKRGERAHVHRTLISVIKEAGHQVISEHTTGINREETASLLEKALGPLPPLGTLDRTIIVRKKMIEAIEGNIDGALFEVSVPSLGTGIEVAHAYLRSRIGLPKIPVLCLYEHGYWPNDLSTMIKGITPEEMPHVQIRSYGNLEEAKNMVNAFMVCVSSKPTHS